MKKGFVMYEGPSMIDGAPIVAILTMKTKNVKTGDMAQLWILRSDVEPHKATKTGQDASICGDCPHRHHTGGACYVTTFQAPLSVYRAYKRGAYATTFTPTDLYMALQGRMVRFGAYGDPAAVPFDMVKHLADYAAGHTGYTHQWARDDFDVRWLSLVMASADSEADAAYLQARGVRYFRVSTTDQTNRREVVCLSESKGMSCADCLLCDGGTKGQSVVIPVHGSRAAKFTDVIAVSQ